jgi:hypothetical protein
MIKTNRLAFFSIVVALYLLLTGFDASAINSNEVLPVVDNHSPAIDTIDLEKPPNVVEVSQNNSQNALLAEPIPMQKNQTLATVKQNYQPSEVSVAKPAGFRLVKPIKSNAVQRALDLSVPFKTDSNIDATTDSKREPQDQNPILFTSDAKKKTQAIRVDGNVLMTQEPELEKRKTVDGAGITINLKQ